MKYSTSFLWKPREDISIYTVGFCMVLDVKLVVCQLCGSELLDCPEVSFMQMAKRIIVSVNSENGAKFKFLCYHSFQSQQLQLEGAVVLIVSIRLRLP